MISKIRILTLSLALIAGISPLIAQTFPTIPYHTVIGRLGAAPGDTGPSQAIPFATLVVQIGAASSTRTISTTAPLAGGGNLTADRALSITANGIDNTLIRQSAALSLVGRAANSTGNVADISAVAASSCAFIESGSTIICGQLATAGIANNAVTLAKLATQASNTTLSNATSGAAIPTAFAMPSCSTSASALNWTTNTGFGCNAAISVAIANVTGLGTGVATALGVNVGSAGAFVTFNGALGTPSSGTGTNLTGIPTTALTGTLQAAQFPALTGDVTTSAGALATTIAANAVSNAKMATMATGTIKANATGGSAVPTDVTAATARSSSLLNVDQFTGRGDSIYTILATDRTVGTNAAFTASRTWTLPAANAVNAGQEIIVADFQGTVTAVNTLVISRAGADTINGGGTSVTMTAANGAYLLKSDGVSKWTAQSMGAASGGGVTSVTCGTGLSGGTITTSGTCATDTAYGSAKLLNTLTASSSATLSDTTSFTSSFNEYEIVLENIVPATNASSCEIQLHQGGAFLAASYVQSQVTSGASTVSAIGPTTFIGCSGASQASSTVNLGISGRFTIFNPAGTTLYKNVIGNYGHLGSGGGYNLGSVGAVNNTATTAVTGFQLLFSSGNIASGVVKIYGRK
jgi:hypothetical protein